MTWMDTEKGRVEIRELSTIEEMVAAEVIQSKVWGPDIIVHPKELLIPVQHEGGLLAGAFSEDGEMIGMIFSFPTHDPQIMHSQMLATVEEWRGQRIGTRLKWYQRDWCLERGYRLLRWTVDPLRAPNAEVNIRHLGCTASIYLLDYYGPMMGIDAGAPTDRLMIDWYIKSEHVSQRDPEPPEDRGFADAIPVFEVNQDRPENLRLDLSAECLLLPIPTNFVKLSRNNPQLAIDWRMKTREAFTHYFAENYTITGFTRQDGPAYLLQRSVS